jgi:hypothetical protein
MPWSRRLPGALVFTATFAPQFCLAFVVVVSSLPVCSCFCFAIIVLRIGQDKSSSCRRFTHSPSIRMAKSPSPQRRVVVVPPLHQAPSIRGSPSPFRFEFVSSSGTSSLLLLLGLREWKEWCLFKARRRDVCGWCPAARPPLAGLRTTQDMDFDRISRRHSKMESRHSFIVLG